MGNAQRDRTAYCDQHQTLLARSRSGLVSRGSSENLARLVKTMRELGILLDEWAVPERVKQSVDVNP